MLFRPVLLRLICRGWGGGNFPATHMYLFVNICLLITARAELFFQLTQVELDGIFETEIDCI